MTPPPDTIKTWLRRDTIGGYWQTAIHAGVEWHMISYNGKSERVLTGVNGQYIERPGIVVPGWG